MSYKVWYPPCSVPTPWRDGNGFYFRHETNLAISAKNVKRGSSRSSRAHAIIASKRLSTNNAPTSTKSKPTDSRRAGNGGKRRDSPNVARSPGLNKSGHSAFDKHTRPLRAGATNLSAKRVRLALRRRLPTGSVQGAMRTLERWMTGVFDRWLAAAAGDDIIAEEELQGPTSL
jgi:hypothetical protein